MWRRHRRSLLSLVVIITNTIASVKEAGAKLLSCLLMMNMLLPIQPTIVWPIPTPNLGLRAVLPLFQETSYANRELAAPMPTLKTPRWWIRPRIATTWTSSTVVNPLPTPNNNTSTLKNSPQADAILPKYFWKIIQLWKLAAIQILC